jgi:hypothetical protein
LPPRGSGQKSEQSIKKKESLYCSGLAVLFVQLNRLSIVEQRTTTTRRGTQGSSCSHSGSDPKTTATGETLFLTIPHANDVNRQSVQSYLFFQEGEDFFYEVSEMMLSTDRIISLCTRSSDTNMRTEFAGPFLHDHIEKRTNVSQLGTKRKKHTFYMVLEGPYIKKMQNEKRSNVSKFEPRERKK